MRGVTRGGVAVEHIGRHHFDDEAISRFRSLLVVKLRRCGATFATIGKVMRMTGEGARKIYISTPPDVRRYYERANLGEPSLEELG